MTTCTNCGYENADDTDFCVRCREYLRWDATEVRPPSERGPTPPGRAPTVPGGPARTVPPARTPTTPERAPTAPLPAPAATPTQAENADTVRVTLRSPDGQGSAGDGPPAVRVTPGARTSTTAIVRNEGQIVDTYALRVEGLPEGWWSVTPQAIHLLPFGSDDRGYEQEVEVALHPPRAPESSAGAWPLRLVAVSGARAGVFGEAAGSLVVERYDELACTLRPERATGTRSARYAVVARNLGNAAVTISLTATDPDDLLRFGFAPAQLQVPAGGEQRVDLTVDAHTTVADREREMRFSVSATSDGASTATAGAFVQRAREPSRWDDRSWLLWLRVALTLLATTLLIAGSFASWVDDGGTGLTGVCAEGTPSGCLDYADTVVAVTGDDLVGAAPTDLPGIAYFVASAGFLTILLGVVALAGLRDGRSAWLAGIAAVIMLTVLAVQADAAGGIAIPMLGGVLAIVAGFLPVVASELRD